MFETRNLADLRGLGWATIGPTRRTLYLSEHYHYPEEVHWTQAHARLAGTRHASGFRGLAFAVAGTSSRVLAPPPLMARAVVVAMLRLDGIDAHIGAWAHSLRGHILVAADNIATQADEDRLIRIVDNRRRWLARPSRTIPRPEFPSERERRGYR